ncbi:MAG: hypothetical protein M3619_05290 [Myxococcota bacterium]|nr:hypothetical protein [Myxococcota bacterium]
MHAVHAGYTIIARLKDDCVDRVRELLAEFRAHPERMPFASALTTHFATATVLDAQRYGDEELPATLMLATSFWGPSRAHEDDLVRTLGSALRALFSHCEGFPASCSDAELVRFLRAHRHADTFYSGMHHLTREDVLRHDELRAAIETFVDQQQATDGFAGCSAGALRREIQRFVMREPTLAWAQAPWQPAPNSWLARQWRSALVLALGGIYVLALVGCTVALAFSDSTTLPLVVACGWLALIIPLFAVFALVVGVWDAERQQRYTAGRQPDADVRSLAATQCRPVINEMTIANRIKDGAARPLVLRIALWIVARAAEGVPRLFPKGINIPTVATARWVAIDRGRRLVFISNFTNAAEPYVRDFIDIRLGAMRINLSFGFGDGYPVTEWIVRRGAVEDPNGFINVVHANQRHTELWYCPYDHLSIDNIKRNRAIREGLFGTVTETEAKAWLQLL